MDLRQLCRGQPGQKESIQAFGIRAQPQSNGERYFRYVLGAVQHALTQPNFKAPENTEASLAAGGVDENKSNMERAFMTNFIFILTRGRESDEAPIESHAFCLASGSLDKWTFSFLMR